MEKQELSKSLMSDYRVIPSGYVLILSAAKNPIKRTDLRRFNGMLHVRSA